MIYDCLVHMCILLSPRRTEDVEEKPCLDFLPGYKKFVFFARFRFLQKTAFSLVNSRLVLGSPGWLFVRHHAENGPIQRKIAVDCP